MIALEIIGVIFTVVAIFFVIGTITILDLKYFSWLMSKVFGKDWDRGY